MVEPCGLKDWCGTTFHSPLVKDGASIGHCHSSNLATSARSQFSKHLKTVPLESLRQSPWILEIEPSGTLLRGRSRRIRPHQRRSWENEVKVLGKMNSLKQEHIVRFFTAFRRGDPDPGFEDHYLMLEWADGGNLRDLWKTLSRPNLTLPLVKAAMTRLQGLADAIHGAHYPVDGPNYRHGDLKPENILWFKSNGDDGVGTLKIGDWGLAKEQMVVTELRTNRTTTPPGTRLYEPPEEVDGFGNSSTTLTPSKESTKRCSRLCDIWSMGCITLEFLIWLMYGQAGLSRFSKELKGNLDNARFYQIKTEKDEREKLPFQIHDVVLKWMKHMKVDPVCKVGQTALGELLNLIETGLLVVQLPEGYGTIPKIPINRAEPPLETRRSNDELERRDNSPIPFAAETNPAIIVSAAEPGSFPMSKQIQSEPEGSIGPRASGGNKRARAPDFANGMFDIFSDDPSDSFWLPGQPGPPPGVESSDSDRLVKEEATLTGNIIGRSHASDTERHKDPGRLGSTSLSVNKTERVGCIHESFNNSQSENHCILVTQADMIYVRYRL